MKQTSLWQEIENSDNYGKKWKAAGIYEGDAEYTSNIRLRVEKGKEKTAQALMALVAQATRQDAFIENFNEEFASSGKRDYLTEYSPTVKVRSKIRISPRLKAKIKAELEKEGISGATITDYSISTSFFTDDYSPATEEQTTDFYEKVNLAIQRAYDISIILGKQQNTGKLVRTPFTGEKSTASRKQTSSNSQTSQAQELPYQIINGYNVSNYNEGIQQGNARDYSNFYDSNEIIEGTHVTPRQVLGSINRMLSQTEHQLNAIQLFTTPEGEVYGFVDKKGDIYLDETVISPEHPIHEYTHLWDRYVAKRNPELWGRGVELMKQTSLWQKIEDSDNYGKKWKAAGITEDMPRCRHVYPTKRKAIIRG